MTTPAFRSSVSANSALTRRKRSRRLEMRQLCQLRNRRRRRSAESSSSYRRINTEKLSNHPLVPSCRHRRASSNQKCSTTACDRWGWVGNFDGFPFRILNGECSQGDPSLAFSSPNMMMAPQFAHLARSGSYIFSDSGSTRLFSDASSVRSLASIGMGSSDGRRITIRKVPNSPSELLSYISPPTWVYSDLDSSDLTVQLCSSTQINYQSLLKAEIINLWGMRWMGSKKTRSFQFHRPTWQMRNVALSWCQAQLKIMFSAKLFFFTRYAIRLDQTSRVDGTSSAHRDNLHTCPIV